MMNDSMGDSSSVQCFRKTAGMLSWPHAFFWFNWQSSSESPALSTRMAGIFGNGDGFAGGTFQRFSCVKTELNWVFNISALLRGVVPNRSPDARVLTQQVLPRAFQVSPKSFIVVVFRKYGIEVVPMDSLHVRLGFLT